MKNTLRFNPEGGLVECLYTEAIDLRTLGRLEITRASDICFSDTSQLWEVHDAETGAVLYCNPFRGQCLQWEHDNLQPIAN